MDFSIPDGCCTFNPMIGVNIVGTGNLGWNLVHSIEKAKGVKLLQLVDRSDRFTHMKHLNRVKSVRDLEKADVCLLAVQDSHIGDLVGELATKDMLVVHCSGATPLSVLDGLSKTGVWYPVQTFSRDRVVSLQDVPIAIETTHKEDQDLLIRLALKLQAKPINVASDQRGVLHLSAVMVNNFVNHLFSLGEDELLKAGLSFDLLLPLIQETVRKASANGPKQSQTGPAMRGDGPTIRKHLDLLNDPITREVYKQLTSSIIEFHGKKL